MIFALKWQNLDFKFARKRGRWRPTRRMVASERDKATVRESRDATFTDFSVYLRIFYLAYEFA